MPANGRWDLIQRLKINSKKGNSIRTEFFRLGDIILSLMVNDL